MAIDENPAEFRRMAKQDIELSTATELLSWGIGLFGCLVWLDGQFRQPTVYIVETVQEFLIKLDMKPCMQQAEINIFSLNLVIVRLTKIMIRSDKNWEQF